MTTHILWLSASPRLKGLDRPLLRILSQQCCVTQWEYCPEWDRGTSFEVAFSLLEDYFMSLPPESPPIHLVGHGLSGVLAFEYARLFPQRIQSVSLLGVAAQTDFTWYQHYFKQRQRLISDNLRPTGGHRQTLVKQMVYQLFDRPLPYPVDCLKTLIARDLEMAPNLHSSGHNLSLATGSVSMPLFVAGSLNDSIVTPDALSEWRRYLKPLDQLWICSAGKHFFHFYYPEEVGKTLIKFWQSIAVLYQETDIPQKVSISRGEIQDRFSLNS